MRNPPVPSRPMALGRRSERSDDPAIRRGRFITQLTGPRAVRTAKDDDVRVVRPVQVNRVAALLRKYGGRHRRLDDMRIFSRPVISRVLRNIYVATSSGLSKTRVAG